MICRMDRYIWGMSSKFIHISPSKFSVYFSITTCFFEWIVTFEFWIYLVFFLMGFLLGFVLNWFCFGLILSLVWDEFELILVWFPLILGKIVFGLWTLYWVVVGGYWSILGGLPPPSSSSSSSFSQEDNYNTNCIVILSMQTYLIYISILISTSQKRC